MVNVSSARKRGVAVAVTTSHRIFFCSGLATFGALYAIEAKPRPVHLLK
jgi:hypothetical protein